MATTIVTKYGSDAPATTDIVRGELAVDTENGRLYTENAAGAVVEIGLKPEANVDVTGTITATGTSVFTNLDISGDIDVDGTTNLDVVDIDGAVDFASTTAHAGNATFADNAKAIFGAGSDLEIYHNPSVGSLIEEVGSGSLFIRASSNIQLESTSGENMAVFNENGAVQLFYDNYVKLATTATGIDVTGSVTADGLTVDGNARIEEIGAIAKLTLERGGTANSADSAAVDMLETNSGTEGANFGDAGTNGFRLKLDGSANDFLIQSGVATTITTRFGIDRDSGDISFYEDTGTTAKLFWDASAESLGIGTSSPSQKLELFNSSSAWDQYAIAQFTTSAGISGSVGYHVGTSSTTDRGLFLSGSGGTTKHLSVTPTGNVGIGTASAQTSLSIETSGTQDVVSPVVTGQTAGVTYGGLYTVRDGAGDQRGLDLKVYTANVGLNTAMRIDSSGNVGIGSNSPSSTFRTSINGDGSSIIGGVEFRNAASGGSTFTIGHASATSPSATLNVVDAANFTIKTSNTERLRIDSDGRALYGTTDTTLYSNTSGNGALINGGGGEMQIACNNGAPLWLNRMGTDSEIIKFYKAGAAVGSIGTKTSMLTIGSGDVGLYFDSANNRIIPFNTTTQVNNDAVFDVGAAAYRYKDAYLSGGIYLGGTAAANKLDDYEEGTWTPAFGAATSNPTIGYSQQVGYYTKVGRLVNVNGYIITTSRSGGSGTLTVDGLPFTAASGIAYSSAAIGFNYNWNTPPLNAGVQGGTDHLLLYQDGRTNAVATPADILASGSSYFYFTCSYYV